MQPKSSRGVQQAGGSDVQSGSSGGLRPHHGLMIAGAAVAAAIVAFWAFSFVIGVVAFLVKLIVVLAVVGLVLKFILGRARKRRT